MLPNYIKTFLLILFSIVFVSKAEAKDEGDDTFTVVIDPGHGGKDIGATENSIKEKDINLKVAKYLESLIKKKLKNTKVVMTRDNDSYLTLQQRADIANKAQGDLFISIHTNSVEKRNKNRKNLAGSTVYTLGLHKDENNLGVAMRENSVIELEQDYQQKYSGFDPQRDESYIIFEMSQKRNLAQSIRFAETVEKELVKAGREERGVHQAGFWVLWATSMPSVLIELDFICNPVSAKYLSSDKGAKEMAEAIFKAVQDYEISWKKNLKGNVNISQTLTDVYNEDAPVVLEESYVLSQTTPVATARTRSHKVSSSNQLNQSKPVLSKRRRRSETSRLLSLNNSYEKDNIIFSNLLTFENYNNSDYIKESMESSLDNLSQDKTKGNDKKKNDKKKQKVEKKKGEKQQKQRKKDAHNAKINKFVTVYKIQILASSDLLSQGNARFCGLTPITTFKENNLYKYYYCESTNREEVESVLADVKKKIPDAFIVSSQKSVQGKNN